MAQLLQNVVTQDAYSPGATVGPASQAERVIIRNGAAAIIAQFWIVPKGQTTPVLEGNERYYNPGAIVSVGNVYGVQIRSAATATPSTVTIELVEDGASDPDVDFQSTGTAAPPLTVRTTQTVFTAAGVAAYTPPAGATAIRVRLIGGGGGGGSTTTSPAGQASTAGGGGGGGYAEVTIPVSSLAPGPIQVTVGAGGAQGVATDSPGSAGGNSSFIDNNGAGTTWAAASGGGGGGGGASLVPPSTCGAGGSAGVGTNGTVLEAGTPGWGGVLFTPSSIFSGAGGGGAGFGGGGGAQAFVGGAGASGAANTGGGGAGGCTPTGGGNRNGGVGGTGIVIIDEYY